MARVAGIDPSLTGMAVATWDAGVLEVHEFTSKPTGPGPRARVLRCNRLVTAVLEVLGDPDLVLVEGYALHAKGRQHALAELGGLLRWGLHHRADRLVEATPTEVKRWATGRGNATKADMISAAAELGYATASSNKADAVCCALLALSTLPGHAPTNLTRLEVAAKVAARIEE